MVVQDDAPVSEINFAAAGKTLHGETAPIGFFTASNITLRGSGYIFKDGKLLNRSSIMLPYVDGMIRESRRNDILPNPKLNDKRIEEPVLIIVAEAPLIYGHWLLDYIPRLWLAKTYLKKDIAELKILLPLLTPPWALRMMKDLFSYSDENFIFYDYYQDNLQIDRAVIPTMLHRAHFFHHMMNEFVNYSIQQARNAQGYTEDCSGNIYISRHKQRHTTSSTRRYLKNEDLVLKTVEEKGYKIICPEEYDWLQQINIFSNAHKVIGEAGSALHNTIFSPGGAFVGTIPPVNYVQISLAGLRSHRLASFSTRDQRNSDGEIEYDIDLERFHRFLDWIQEM